MLEKPVTINVTINKAPNAVPVSVSPKPTIIKVPTQKTVVVKVPVHKMVKVPSRPLIVKVPTVTSTRITPLPVTKPPIIHIHNNSQVSNPLSDTIPVKSSRKSIDIMEKRRKLRKLRMFTGDGYLLRNRNPLFRQTRVTYLDK